MTVAHSSGGVRRTDRLGAEERIRRLLDRRTEANRRFFEAEAERIARLCHRIAERFARGGRLVALGTTPAERADVHHVAVEFVHPVIVGKRALPALGLSREGGPLAHQVALLVEPEDIVLGFGASPETAGGLAAARERGALTVATAPGAGADWELDPREGDRFVRQELVETLYHVLWELVHVFFEHRGLFEGRDRKPVHDTGASSFPHPFLSEGETDLESVVDDVQRSVLAKAEEVAALREETLEENRESLLAAAATLRRSFDRGGKLLALGNGGSATAAMDAVADFREPPHGSGWPARPALDLTESPAILTAIANDVGHEAVFSRQVIAYGREGDVALGFSTSGGSENVLQAFAEARRRGLATIAFAGYGGGRVADEDLADHVIVTRSEHVPRTQEAQATACHILRELVETVEALEETEVTP